MANILRGNKSTQVPHNLMFVDTETYPATTSESGRTMIHRLRVGCFKAAIYEHPRMTRCRLGYFRDSRAFWEEVYGRLDERRPLWIFSHNAGFDSTICGLWIEVEEGRAELEFAVTENPPTIIKFKVKGCTVYWLDSMNWFRESLKDIGESIGMPKLPMPDGEQDETAWMLYCERDVCILEEAIRQLLAFHIDNDLGVFKMTAASQSLQTYRHRFSPMQELTSTVYKGNGSTVEMKQHVCRIEPHTVSAIHELERDSYHQGIGWVFHFGHVVNLETYLNMVNSGRKDCAKRARIGPIYQLDVNSLYPAIMRNMDMPVRLMGFTYSPPVELIGDMLNSFCIVANVLVDINYGFVPGRLNRKPGFYHGHFWTTLCTPELRELYNHGRIKAVSMLAWYDKANVFSEFVDYFYGKRCQFKREGKKIFANLCKLYLNSLYGKFAQRQGQWINLQDVQPKVRWGEWSEKCHITGKLLHFRGLGNITQARGDDANMPHTFTAISSHVTSAGRVYMQKLFRDCGVENIFYCNVDSIHCNMEGLARLQDKGDVNEYILGALKNEGHFQRAEYRGVRNYSLDGVDTVAGLNSTCKKLAEKEYECLDFQRLNDVLSHTPKAEIVISKETKHIGNTFHDGMVEQDGRTKPYRLEMWDTKSIVDLFAESEQMGGKPTAEEG